MTNKFSRLLLLFVILPIKLLVNREIYFICFYLEFFNCRTQVECFEIVRYLNCVVDVPIYNYCKKLKNANFLLLLTINL